jgi:hypothetical protein
MIGQDVTFTDTNLPFDIPGNCLRGQRRSDELKSHVVMRRSFGLIGGLKISHRRTCLCGTQIPTDDREAGIIAVMFPP